MFCLFSEDTLNKIYAALKFTRAPFFHALNISWFKKKLGVKCQITIFLGKFYQMFDFPLPHGVTPLVKKTP